MKFIIYQDSPIPNTVFFRVLLIQSLTTVKGIPFLYGVKEKNK